MNTHQNIARIENDFIFNAQYQLTAKEQKVVLFLIANINPVKQNRFEVQVISVKELRHLIMEDCTGGSFYEEMVAFSKRIGKKSIDFNSEFRMEGRMVPGYVNWFQSITPKQNEKGELCLKFLFSEDLKPFLLELNRYVQIDFKETLGLVSGFSVRMLQVFKAELQRNAKYHNRASLKYSLMELKQLLAVEDKYPDYRNFKRKVLDVIVEDINKHTALNVSFSTVKQHKTIIGVVFEFWENTTSVSGIRNIPTAAKLAPTLLSNFAKQKPLPIASPSLLNLDALSFAQLKAFQILQAYKVKDAIALEMIAQTKGSEIKGFEDWYFEAVLKIFDSKTNIKSPANKAGALVNWFLKMKVFEQGDHFAVIMEQLQARKKGLQREQPNAWENRLASKNMTAEEFRRNWGQKAMFNNC